MTTMVDKMFEPAQNSSHRTIYLHPLSTVQQHPQHLECKEFLLGFFWPTPLFTMRVKCVGHSRCQERELKVRWNCLLKTFSEVSLGK